MPKHNRDTVSVNLPFAGFYESKWSGMIDQQEENYIEWTAEEATHEFHDIAKAGDWQLANLLVDHTDYRACYAAIAKAYVEWFQVALERETGLNVPFEYEATESPKYYNFETDRLFAKAPLTFFYLMLRRHRRDKYQTLSGVIERRHTSCSGFISFYSSDLDDWLEKPLRAWDHNELSTLLIAFIELETGAPVDDFEWSIFEDWPDSGYHEWQAGVNWQALETAVEKWREDRDEAERALDPDYKPPTPRCPFTRDLFA